MSYDYLSIQEKRINEILDAIEELSIAVKGAFECVSELADITAEIKKSLPPQSPQKITERIPGYFG